MRSRATIALLLLLTLTACAGGTARPVLYPNAKLESVGRAQADADIVACERMAREAGTGERGRGGETARRAGVGAAIGAATGAAVGAITGNVGRGAAIGAVTGTAGGVTSGAFNENAGANSTYRNFVSRCLADKGYEVVGFE